MSAVRPSGPKRGFRGSRLLSSITLIAVIVVFSPRCNPPGQAGVALNPVPHGYYRCGSGNNGPLSVHALFPIGNNWGCRATIYDTWPFNYDTLWDTVVRVDDSLARQGYDFNISYDGSKIETGCHDIEVLPVNVSCLGATGDSGPSGDKQNRVMLDPTGPGWHLSAWIGDSTYGAVGEGLSQPRSYSLYARLTHNKMTSGVNGFTLIWLDMSGDTWSDTTSDGAVPPHVQGEAQYAGVCNSSVLCAQTGERRFRVSMADQPTVRDTFIVVGTDEESDSVPIGKELAFERWRPDTSHPYEPVAGDGYFGGTNDPNPYAENVRLEIDRSSSFLRDDVDAAMVLVESTYNAVGITVDYSLDEDNISDNTEFDIPKARQMLASHRNTSCSGLGRGRIHVIMAGTLSSELNEGIQGFTVTYDDVDKTQAALWSSSGRDGHGSTPYLDSVGVIIPNTVLSPHDNWTAAQQIAVVLAHEVAHCLCLPEHRTDSTNVLSRTVDLDSGRYISYSRFKGVPAWTTQVVGGDTIRDTTRFNLRHVLGRDAVTNWWITPFTTGH